MSQRLRMLVRAIFAPTRSRIKVRLVAASFAGNEPK